ncbi:MAG: tyrosine-type recombinase/integrase, partial [Helicobacter sp.]
MKLYLKIALFTGMRVNEILALKYEDIDLKRNIIHVCKTL